MDLFAMLAEVYSGRETRIETRNGIDYFVIVNPFWNENIRICSDDIIFFFSFQHAHFDFCHNMDENIELLIEYIDRFLHKREVAVEFFIEGETDFGGSICLDDIDLSSGKSALKSFSGEYGYKSFSKRAEKLACRCSIRSWNDAGNMDIDFVVHSKQT